MPETNIIVGDISVSFDDDLSFFVKESETSPKVCESRSVKDLIESLGVPHCEVQLIHANGKAVFLDYLVQPGDQIRAEGLAHRLDVTAAPRLARPQLKEPRFIADVHLGKLVRYLRMLGLDCYYQEPWDDELLAQISADQQRIMLTRDVGLLKRSCIDYGVFLRSDQAIEQAQQLLDWLVLEPFIKRFSRCVKCNGKMSPVAKDQILHLIPEGTRRSYDEFYQCQACGKVFWKGAHFNRLQGILDKIRAARF